MAPGDPGVLAAAIRGLIDDPRARAELGVRAAEAARSVYSWESVAAETEAVYEAAIAGAGK